MAWHGRGMVMYGMVGVWYGIHFMVGVWYGMTWHGMDMV